MSKSGLRKFIAEPVSRWRCAIGWAVYLIVAVLIVAFAGAAAA